MYCHKMHSSPSPIKLAWLHWYWLYTGPYYIIILWNKIAQICLSVCLLDLSVEKGDGEERESRAEAVCTFPSWDGWPWQIAGCNVSNALYAVLTADYPRGLRWEAHVIGGEQSQDPGQTVMCQRPATDPWLGQWAWTGCDALDNTAHSSALYITLILWSRCGIESALS